jgi:hypothetical protein
MNFHAGSVLGVPDSKVSFIGFCLLLHREMFFGLPGELVMGVMALSLVISLCVRCFGPSIIDATAALWHLPKRCRAKNPLV